MDSQSPQNNTKLPLLTKHIDAFIYRMMGLNYKEIAVKTGYSHDYIRHLFSKKGLLFELWERWQLEVKEESMGLVISLQKSLDSLAGRISWLEDKVKELEKNADKNFDDDTPGIKVVEND